MGQALTTDLYQLNMAASYLRRNMTEPATFSLFVRNLPPGRGFLVAAGLQDCLDYLEGFRFEPDELSFLDERGYDDDVIQALADLRFTGEVIAVPEGRIVFANEPLLEVTAPLPQAQLVETYLLNRVTFQTAIAAKAARCHLAAGPDVAVVDFALRRTHGIDAAMAVARLSAMVGFGGTSNVEAARRYGLRAVGTMAHAFIEAFPSEVEAFRAFGTDFPAMSTFLVDTYDTLTGVRHAIEVITELGLTENLAIRLDSGDLLELAKSTRRLLDDAGMPHVRVFVSGGLDEHDIERLLSAGAPIDAFGIGTRVGVSADAPALDSAYKLVQYAGNPVLKLSAGKETFPAPKQVFRRTGSVEDILALRTEECPPAHEPLLEPVMIDGRRVGPPSDLATSRQRFETDLECLPAAVRQLSEPSAPAPTVSDALRDLTAQVAARHGHA